MKTSRKILILTSAHLCRNPRVVKEATTLGAAGYDVTVMSISVQERFEQMDRKLMHGLPFKRITIDHTPSARLANFAQRGATWVARQLLIRFGWETAQALGPAGTLLRLARQFPSDLVIAHTEIPLWIAPHLIADGRRVAVDMEDWYSQDLLPDDRRCRPLRLLREAEAIALQRAAYVSTTSASMALALTEANGGQRPIVLRNTFPLQPRPPAQRGTPGGSPRFIWFSQTIGPGRGLEQFLAAWAGTTRPSEVFLLGEVRPGYRASLLDSLPAARRGGLNFIPPVTPVELPGKLAEFDLGLALENRFPPSRDVTITNKILQYLNAGLAVVATDTAGQREVMQAASGCGMLADNIDAVSWARQLDALLGDSAQLRRMQQAARTAAEREFCWEHDAPRLLAAVARALATSPPAA